MGILEFYEENQDTPFVVSVPGHDFVAVVRSAKKPGFWQAQFFDNGQPTDDILNRSFFQLLKALLKFSPDFSSAKKISKMATIKSLTTGSVYDKLQSLIR